MDFATRMLDLLLESAGAPPADADNVAHWLTKACEPHGNRSYCWVCHKKRPNLTCPDCVDDPILCLDCAGQNHNDPSLCKPFKKRRRENEEENNASEPEAEGKEEKEHEANAAGADVAMGAVELEDPAEGDAMAFAQEFMLDQLQAEQSVEEMDVHVE